MEVESSVQILNNVPEECKLKIATLPNQGGESIRKCGGFPGEYGLESKDGIRYE